MASSRLERIGTIFTRVEGLLRSGAMKMDDRPLWWDIYRAFPPTREPLFGRPAPNLNLRPIYYEEDVIRGKFHKSGQPQGTFDLMKNRRSSTAQKFVHLYMQNKKQSNLSDEELYEQCLDTLKAELDAARTERTERIAKNESKAPVQDTQNIKSYDTIKNIFDS